MSKEIMPDEIDVEEILYRPEIRMLIKSPKNSIEIEVTANENTHSWAQLIIARDMFIGMIMQEIADVADKRTATECMDFASRITGGVLKSLCERIRDLYEC